MKVPKIFGLRSVVKHFCVMNECILRILLTHITIVKNKGLKIVILNMNHVSAQNEWWVCII